MRRHIEQDGETSAVSIGRGLERLGTPGHHCHIVVQI